eukprot:TRINITY_DN67599_c7_g8_i1.p1 TRINITY_DN67599_c7_g8~~TRINITY_DN67599_c7_g8_i1.p1  ORF type:complete len:1176 (-),score=109.37 TRINITY_DN67599_c7_g8_i1:748-4275(-)
MSLTLKEAALLRADKLAGKKASPPQSPAKRGDTLHTPRGSARGDRRNDPLTKIKQFCALLTAFATDCEQHQAQSKIDKDALAYSKDESTKINTGQRGVVCLDVGGVEFRTNAATLRKHPDSNLYLLFTKRATDKTFTFFEDDRIFIDRDPKWFSYILNYLRTDTVVIPKDKEDRNALLSEASWYGLDGMKQELEKKVFEEKIEEVQELERALQQERAERQSERDRFHEREEKLVKGLLSRSPDDLGKLLDVCAAGAGGAQLQAQLQDYLKSLGGSIDTRSLRSPSATSADESIAASLSGLLDSDEDLQKIAKMQARVRGNMVRRRQQEQQGQSQAAEQPGQPEKPAEPLPKPGRSLTPTASMSSVATPTGRITPSIPPPTNTSCLNLHALTPGSPLTARSTPVPLSPTKHCVNPMLFPAPSVIGPDPIVVHQLTRELEHVRAEREMHGQSAAELENQIETQLQNSLAALMSNVSSDGEEARTHSRLKELESQLETERSAFHRAQQDAWKRQDAVNLELATLRKQKNTGQAEPAVADPAMKALERVLEFVQQQLTFTKRLHEQNASRLIHGLAIQHKHQADSARSASPERRQVVDTCVANIEQLHRDLASVREENHKNDATYAMQEHDILEQLQNATSQPAQYPQEPHGTIPHSATAVTLPVASLGGAPPVEYFQPFKPLSLSGPIGRGLHRSGSSPTVGAETRTGSPVSLPTSRVLQRFGANASVGTPTHANTENHLRSNSPLQVQSPMTNPPTQPVGTTPRFGARQADGLPQAAVPTVGTGLNSSPPPLPTARRSSPPTTVLPPTSATTSSFGRLVGQHQPLVGNTPVGAPAANSVGEWPPQSRSSLSPQRAGPLQTGVPIHSPTAVAGSTPPRTATSNGSVPYSPLPHMGGPPPTSMTVPNALASTPFNAFPPSVNSTTPQERLERSRMELDKYWKNLIQGRDRPPVEQYGNPVASPRGGLLPQGDTAVGFTTGLSPLVGGPVGQPFDNVNNKQAMFSQIEGLEAEVRATLCQQEALGWRQLTSEIPNPYASPTVADSSPQARFELRDDSPPRGYHMYTDADVATMPPANTTTMSTNNSVNSSSSSSSAPQPLHKIVPPNHPLPHSLPTIGSPLGGAPIRPPYPESPGFSRGLSLHSAPPHIGPQVGQVGRFAMHGSPRISPLTGLDAYQQKY